MEKNGPNTIFFDEFGEFHVRLGRGEGVDPNFTTSHEGERGRKIAKNASRYLCTHPHQLEFFEFSL